MRSSDYQKIGLYIDQVLMENGGKSARFPLYPLEPKLWEEFAGLDFQVIHQSCLVLLVAMVADATSTHPIQRQGGFPFVDDGLCSASSPLRQNQSTKIS